jgi:hypothetical protein
MVPSALATVEQLASYPDHLMSPAVLFSVKKNEFLRLKKEKSGGGGGILTTQRRNKLVL